MCGELEEEVSPDEEIYNRYVAHVHAFLAALKKGKSGDAVHSHLDRLFRGLLLETVDERKAPQSMSGFQRMVSLPRMCH